MIHYITTNGVGNAWVGNELRTLGKSGVKVVLHSIRAPGSTFFSSADVKQMNQETRLIYPLNIPAFLLSMLLAPFLFGGRYFSALANALFSERESFVIRIKTLWHFIVACHWARSLRDEPVDMIHSQWVHSSGSVGMYGAWLLNVPFGFTGHAADLFRERAALKDKIKRADYIICISYFHRDFYLIHGAKPQQLRIVYCGIDVSQFSPRQGARPGDGPFQIISSGRLVEKKGFEYLIDACQLLVGRIEFKCTIAGSGPLEQSLKARVKKLELDEYVEVTGKPLLQEEITQFMHSGDCYCLPCVWASDNDVDGLPQMLMEAMACGIPVISTRLVGIPDLIDHNQNGLLLEPNDAQAIADAFVSMHDNPGDRQAMAAAGRQHVTQKFNLENCLEPLAQQFEVTINSNQPQ